MTPEQEQLLIAAVANHERGFNDLREGQAMMMQQFNERDARMEIMRMEYERDMRELQRQVAELRLDFLNHMRAYHPPLDR
jgi:hypothetical protein